MVYATVLFPPNWFWPLALISSTIPLFLFYHLFSFLWKIRRGWKKLWTHGIALATGFPFLMASFGIPKAFLSDGALHVLSYNVHGFRNTQLPNNAEGMRNFYEWTVEHPAAIKVFQEFYCQKDQQSNDTYTYFINKGYYGLFEPLTVGTLYHEMGLAIFSKYPIINSGRLFPVDVKDGDLNNVVFADILFQKDTVRIYNAHFQSMGIDPNHVLETNQLKDQYANVGKKFVAGSLKRTWQFEQSLKHAAECPYPVIFAGDFNALPYSYGYMKFRRQFKNAFEQMGTGFGFSMNSELWFLRIDNIFYEARKFRLTRFKTRNDIKYSDHFPIEGEFELGK